MNKLILMLVLFCSMTTMAQQSDSSAVRKWKKSRKVSFITKFDKANASKDGFYLNGYVVNIDWKKVDSLQGKMIRVRGRATLHPGLKRFRDGELRQGREEDTWYIYSPKIEIVK